MTTETIPLTQDQGGARPDGPGSQATPSAACASSPAGADPSRVPVFVFGSNLAGRHGKGAALWARQHRGAVYGQGHGIQGQSYAIPTKGHRLETLPLSIINGFVQEFLMFARKYWMREFQLTPIGCGLAGYTRAEIEPMFANAPGNVIWPPEWGNRYSDSDASLAENAQRSSGGAVAARAGGIAQTPSSEPTP